MKLADFDDVLRTNLTGAFLLTQAVISSMMKARWGRIINITSIVGRNRLPQARPTTPPPRPASIGLTKSLRPRVRLPRHHR